MFALFFVVLLAQNVSAEKMWTFNDYNVTANAFIGDGSGLTNINVSDIGLSSYVPYVGATSNVDLGANNFLIDTNTFFVNSTNGYVGIGTASPQSDVHAIYSSDNEPRGFLSENVISSVSGPIFYFRKSRGTIGSEEAVNAGDSLGAIAWNGRDENGYTNHHEALIQSWASQNFSASGGDYGSYLTIQLVPDDSGYNLNEIARFTGNGKFGLGTSNPDNSFHVQVSDASASSNLNAVATFEKNDHAYLQLLTPSNKVSGILFGDNNNNAMGRIAYQHSSDRMDFYTADSNVMVIDNSGNIGIGTTSPIGKLNVVGDLNVSGTSSELFVYGTGNSFITGNLGIGTTN
ncbi:hypothetical protein L6261_03240, partial [Candidatus Parcubacteria bacterium]|nr:hypothetical protein [Candidatus Parcubacteria bacterium]